MTKLAEGQGEGDVAPMGGGIDTFEVANVYPRYPELPKRSTILDRMQLTEFKQEASTKGISAQALTALDGVTPDQGVLSRDHSQRVFQQSFEEFAKRINSLLKS